MLYFISLPTSMPNKALKTKSYRWIRLTCSQYAWCVDDKAIISLACNLTTTSVMLIIPATYDKCNCRGHGGERVSVHDHDHRSIASLLTLLIHSLQFNAMRINLHSTRSLFLTAFRRMPGCSGLDYCSNGMVWSAPGEEWSEWWIDARIPRNRVAVHPL